MLLNGRVLLQQSVIGKAGQVYRFNVTVSVYCLGEIHISIPTFVKFAEHNSNFLWVYLLWQMLCRLLLTLIALTKYFLVINISCQ